MRWGLMAEEESWMTEIELMRCEFRFGDLVALLSAL
jgi:hypothetical protein